MRQLRETGAGGLERLLAARSGIVRAEELAPWLTLREVGAEVAAGRWQRLGRGIVAAHNGALTVEQERWRAVLSATRGAALGGLTAAELDGFAGFPPRHLDLVVPAGGVASYRDGVRVHLSTRLDDLDVHPVHDPRRTRLPRSIVDAAAWAPNDRLARAFVLAAVQQRLVRPDDLADALTRRGPMRRRALVDESIGDARGGVHSLPEREFELLRRRLRLPQPDRQAAVERSGGRSYLDVWWRRFRVGVEVHGRQHLEIFGWESDLARMSELAIDGKTILQVSSYAVRRDSAAFEERLLRALRAGRWTG